MDVTRSLIIILLTALTTFFTRALPFIIFRKKVPKIITYLGSVLTPAIIACLVIYCLRNTSFNLDGLAAISCSILVIILHLIKRNIFLSIGLPTILYMILIQYIF